MIAGGDIGSASALLPVEVVESPQAAIGLNAAAGGNLNLSVRARLRDPSVTTFSPQLGSLVAGGNIDLELQSAVSDNVVSGPVYDVTVTQTLPDFGGLTHTITVVNAWPHDGGSPPLLPPGIFAGGSTPINATYNIGLLQASGSISVTDPDFGDGGCNRAYRHDRTDGRRQRVHERRCLADGNHWRPARRRDRVRPAAQ